eukprot:m.377907 g.377907  ORF g.377907 m.377907 type:complete len:83 (+) comp20024_c1_seq1:212-460(+)
MAEQQSTQPTKDDVEAIKGDRGGQPDQPRVSRRPVYVDNPFADDPTDTAAASAAAMPTAAANHDAILDSYRDTLTCFACSRR